MKNVRKKGFSLIELVIVIAVIAILAGVMIGTFASVVDSAKQSKALQEWKMAADTAYMDFIGENNDEPSYVVTTGKSLKFVKSDYVAGEGETKYNLTLEPSTAKYVPLTEDVYLLRTSAGFQVITGKVDASTKVLTYSTGTAALAQ